MRTPRPLTSLRIDQQVRAARVWPGTWKPSRWVSPDDEGAVVRTDSAGRLPARLESRQTGRPVGFVDRITHRDSSATT